MPPVDAFKELLSVHVHGKLKPLGFKKSGQTFGWRGAGVWGTINFQRDKWSTREQIGFTINVGVQSDFISSCEFVSGSRVVPDKIPSGLSGDWSRRIGQLMPANKDVWWTLAESQLSEQVRHEVMGAIVDYAVPALAARRSDEALVEEIRRGAPLSRLMADAALLRRYGTPEEFEDVARRILQSSSSMNVHYFQSELERIRQRVQPRV